MPTQSKFTKYFKLLGLPKTATESDIRDAYRKLARSYHPDKASPEDPEESKEAHKYMAGLNEAYNILINHCMPIRSALKRRLSANPPSPEEPPSKKTCTRNSDTIAAPSVSEAVIINPQPSWKQSSINIDVGQIRIVFSEMKKSRLMDYFRQVSLRQSDLGLRERESKVDNVIFATSHKVREILRENRCPHSDLEHQVELLCQSFITTKWAHNSKIACVNELVDNHGYDHVCVAKLTHWQLINELVKVLTQPGTFPFTMRLTATVPTQTRPTLPKSPSELIQLRLYHPQSHPELPQNLDYALPHPSKSATTLHHEQSTLTLSHATNLTLSSASHLLTLNNDCLESAWAHHTTLRSQFPLILELIYLTSIQQLSMKLSRETGLTAQAAGLGLEAMEYDYAAVKQRFKEGGGTEGIYPGYLVPKVKMIEWIDQDKGKEKKKNEKEQDLIEE